MAEVKEMGKLPEGWRSIRVGDLGSFKTSSVDKKIRANEMEVTANKHQYRVNQVLKGDILFTPSSETPDDIGHSAVVIDDLENTLYSYHLVRLRIKDYDLDLKFRGYVFNARYVLSQFEKLSSGVTRFTLAKKDFEGLSVVYPEYLPEQRKIAEILETVDNAIEKTDRIIEKHKRIKQGLMQDLLTRGIDENGEIRREETHRFKDSELGRIPEEWEVVEFKEICKVRQGLQIAIANRFKEPGPKRFIYITIQYLNSEDKDKDVEYIQNPPKSVICRKYDLLMTRTGNTGMVITNVEGVFHNNFFLVDYNKKKIGKIYLFYYLNLSWIQEAIRALAGTTTIPDLNHRDFYSLKFLKPSLPEQHRIASILSQIDETIEKEQKYKEKLERIKQGFMEDLLTGKVRVNHLIEKGVENVPQT